MKSDELIEKIKQADDDYRHKFIPINLDIEIEDVLGAFEELKQKLHDAEMAKYDAEAANTEYREDIKKLKAENERLKEKLQNLNDAYCRLDAMYQIDTGIACKVFGQGSVNCKALRATLRALWLARAERAKAVVDDCDNVVTLCKTFRPFEEVSPLVYHKAITWQKVERLCRAKAEEYK